MNPRIKASVLVIFLIAGIVAGFGIGANPMNSLNIEEVKINSRKLLSFKDVIMDYDDPGPNPKHGKKGGNGGGSKNP
ncbi:uncharacterized protein LOC142548004 [Primulina tabacum]|uniref:uncharacterized protein LOC142548004 n=1 Tax=Primulina tabacum TaxID=48773 RepID=UPI003F5A0C15